MAKHVATKLENWEDLLSFFRQNCQYPTRRSVTEAGKELTEIWCENPNV